MKECPFCREEIQDGAIKCRHCRTLLVAADADAGADAGSAPASDDKLTYVVDRSLLTFLKIAAGLVAIVIGVSAFVFGLDFRSGTKDVAEAVEKMRALIEVQSEQTKKAAELAKKLEADARKMEALRVQAEETSRLLGNLDVAFDERVKRALQDRSFGLEEDEVKEIVEEILVGFVAETDLLQDRSQAAKIVKEVAERIPEKSKREVAVPAARPASPASPPATAFRSNLEPADPARWPWSVVLALRRSGGELFGFCNGVAIGSGWVMTTAHCAVGNDMFVFAPGDYFSSSQGQGIRVAQVFAHPAHDAKTNVSDIALLKLERDLQARAPRLGRAAEKGEVTLAGMARGDASAQRAEMLQAEVLIVSNAKCQEAYQATGVAIVDGMLCTQGEIGGCFLSGVPVVAGADGTDRVVGFAALGIGCGDGRFPSVHTRVATFLPWIREVTGLELAP